MDAYQFLKRSDAKRQQYSGERVLICLVKYKAETGYLYSAVYIKLYLLHFMRGEKLVCTVVCFTPKFLVRISWVLYAIKILT